MRKELLSKKFLGKRVLIENKSYFSQNEYLVKKFDSSGHYVLLESQFSGRSGPEDLVLEWEEVKDIKVVTVLDEVAIAAIDGGGGTRPR